MKNNNSMILCIVFSCCVWPVGCDNEPGKTTATNGDDAIPHVAQIHSSAITVLVDEDEEPSPQEACVNRYGSIEGFEMCLTTPTTCSFNAEKGLNKSCDDICEAAGGTCLTAFGNTNYAPCRPRGEIRCDRKQRQSDICVCSNSPQKITVLAYPD